MIPAPPRHAVPVPPGKAADEIPAAFVWVSLVVVAGPSLYALAWFQHRLLETLWPGAPSALTYGLALAVDSFGAMCGVYWFRSNRNKVLRRWGRTFAILAVLGSTALMVWAIARIYPGAQVLGALPAVIVFGSTKLVTMWQADRAQNRDVLADAAGQVGAAEAARDAAVTERDAAVAELVAERDARDAREADLLARLEALESRPVPAARELTTTDTGPIPAVQRTRSAPGSSVTNIAVGGSMTDQGKRFVREYIAEHGRRPSGGEIERAVGARDSFGRKLLGKMDAAGELPELPEGDSSDVRSA